MSEELAQLRCEVAALREEVAALRQTPAAAPRIASEDPQNTPIGNPVVAALSRPWPQPHNTIKPLWGAKGGGAP